MDMMNFMDFCWFVQFKSTSDLKRMCVLLEDELEMDHVDCPTRDDAMKRLDELAMKRFTRACYGRDCIIDLSIVDQLREWWTQKKEAK